MPKNEASAENLVLYLDHDMNGEKRWGYLNDDTGEIVIKAKYAEAGPFIGNFALVKELHDGKSLIINTNEKVIFSGEYSDIYLIASESGKNHVAILKTEYKRLALYLNLFAPYGGDTKSHFYWERDYKFSLISLPNKKTIIPKRNNALEFDFQTAGDYFIADGKLFQFLDNGNVKHIDMNSTSLANEFLENYLAKRGLHAESDIENSRIYYELYYHGEGRNPDLTKAFETLKEIAPEFTMPFNTAIPFYHDYRLYLHTPLETIEQKYVLLFTTDMYWSKRALGIYNLSKNEWELLPFFTIGDENELYYITSIAQTNNPKRHRIFLRPDISDKKYPEDIVFGGGGIYDIEKRTFIDDLYVSGDVESVLDDGFFKLDEKGWSGGWQFPKDGVFLFYDRTKIVRSLREPQGPSFN
jgi:hypothetical protein